MTMWSTGSWRWQRALITLCVVLPHTAATNDTGRDGAGTVGDFWRQHHSQTASAPSDTQQSSDAAEQKGPITIFGRSAGQRAKAKVFRAGSSGDTVRQRDATAVESGRRLLLADDEAPTVVRCPRRQGPMDALDDDVKRFMDEYGIEGASLAYRLKDGTSVQRAFGVRRRDEPMTVDTTMRLASLSKPITAAGIMLLVQNGKLRLDEFAFDILQHLLYDDQRRPRYDSETNSTVEQRWKRVTVRHLMEHTAGWPSNVPSRDPIMMAFDLSSDELVPWTIDNVPLTDEPGAAFHYSNFGYVLLGRVIEARANGTSYEAAVRRSVLRPCGVADTMYVRRRHAPAGFVQTAYFASMESPFSVPIERADAALGWIGRPADFLQLLVCLGGGSDGMRLLNATSAAAMRHRSTRHSGFGMGWTLPRETGDYAHFGALPGSAAYARHWHRSGANTVLVLNRRHEVPSLAEAKYRRELADFHRHMATLLQPDAHLDNGGGGGSERVKEVTRTVATGKKRRGGQELNASLNVADRHVTEQEFRL